MTGARDWSEAIGPLCAFLSSLTWAIGSASYARWSHQYTAFAVNFTRAVIAFILFSIAIFVTSGGWNAGLAEIARLRWSHVGWFGLSMISSYGIGDVLFLWSTRSLGVPGALAIASCYPIWTTLAGWVFLQQGLSALSAVGLVVTVVGVITVVLSSGAQVSQRGRVAIVKGLCLGLMTSLFWALNGYSISRGGVDLLAAVGSSVRMGLAIGMSGLLTLLLARGERMAMAWKDVRPGLWVFALEAFGGSYLFLVGLTRSSLALGATLSSLAPVLSVPISVGMGLERLSWKKVAGVSLTVAGIAALLLG